MRHVFLFLCIIISITYSCKVYAYTPFAGASDAVISCLNTTKTPDQQKKICASGFIVKICTQEQNNYSLHSNAMCMLREYSAWKTALEEIVRHSPFIKRNLILHEAKKNTQIECKKSIENTGPELKRLGYYKCARDLTIAHALQNYDIRSKIPSNFSTPEKVGANKETLNK